MQTLHNYRLLCLNSKFFRYNQQSEAEICEKCHKRSFKYPRYQISLLQGINGRFSGCGFDAFSAQVIGNLENKVSAYIALTEFQKQKMSEGGLPEERIFVKPNFVCSEAEKEASRV